ncbi:MAG: DUF2059 domain-containing protein [Aquabacterium sp.]
MKKHHLASLSVVLGTLVLFPSLGWAQGPATKELQEKNAAAARYFKAVPFAEMQRGVAEEVAKQFPPDKQADFLKFMNQEVNWASIEVAAKTSLLRHLSTAELNAMADFMEKPEGKSAMNKMKYYMADLMPVIQAEVQRAMAKRMAAGEGKKPAK